MDDFVRFLLPSETEIARLVVALAIILLAFGFWRGLRRMYRRYLQRSNISSQQATLVRIIVDIIRIVILLAAVLLVLQIYGVNVSSAIAGFGIAGAIVGLALQDTLKDVMMGVHMMFDHFFLVGDVVRYGDLEGTVVGFNTRTTTIRNIRNGSITSICNRDISQITKLPPLVFVDIDVPLSYEADPHTVHTVLRGLCEKIGELKDVDRCEYRGTHSFEDSAILYKVRFYSAPAAQFDCRRDAMHILQEGLNEAGLQIPYNQYDVHIRS